MVVLAEVLAGCSLGDGRGAGSTSGSPPALSEGQVVSDRGVAIGPAQADGIIKGRVFTAACGGPAASSCPLRVYRGSLVF